MSQKEIARWLVTYDIADPRRLNRIFRYLKRQGVPVQYSVFLVEASAVKITDIMRYMTAIIHPQVDDVRAYRLPSKLWQVSLGKSILPEDSLPSHDFLRE